MLSHIFFYIDVSMYWKQMKQWYIYNIVITFRFLQFLKTTVLIMLLLITYTSTFFPHSRHFFFFSFFCRDGGFVPSKHQSHNPFIDLRPFGKLMLVLLLCNQLRRLGDRHLWYATPTFFCSRISRWPPPSFENCRVRSIPSNTVGTRWFSPNN